MKGILKKNWSSRLYRPLVRQVLFKCAVGAAAALLWDRFIDTADNFSVVEYVFPIIGAIFAALTWFSYLSVDGITLPRFHLFERKKRPTRQSGDIADFTDEPIHTADLEPKERAVCKLVANIICTALFLLPGVIYSLI